jgi:hypothetical protein
MLGRDLKMQAIALATQLPDDKETARKVHAYLGELIEQWIFTDEPGQLSKALPGQSLEAEASFRAETKYIGKAPALP